MAVGLATRDRAASGTHAARRAHMPGAWPVWLLCASLLSVDVAWMWPSGSPLTPLVARFGIPAVLVVIGAAASLAPPSLATRRIGSTAIAFAQVSAIVLSLALTTYAVAALTPRPLADVSLAHADMLLGFDWAAWARWTDVHALVHSVLRYTYPLLALEGVVCSVVLGWRVDVDEFIAAVACTVLPTLALFALFPAVGHLPHDPAVQHLLALRDGTLRVVPAHGLRGFVSFPSYHTTLALVYAYALRRTRLAWPVYVFTALMLLSIPTEGGHYLVDVLGGAAVAVVACGVATMADRRLGHDPELSRRARETAA